MSLLFTSETWTARFLDLAVLVASWSRDPSTKVGAVVVNARKRVVGLGFNGFPDKIEDKAEWLADRETKYAMIIHAEVNAILNATASVDGCAMFVSHMPCGDCGKFLVQAGIAEVHFRDGGPDFDARWRESALRSEAVFGRAGVPVVRHVRQ